MQCVHRTSNSAPCSSSSSQRRWAILRFLFSATHKWHIVMRPDKHGTPTYLQPRTHILRIRHVVNVKCLSATRNLMKWANWIVHMQTSTHAHSFFRQDIGFYFIIFPLPSHTLLILSISQAFEYSDSVSAIVCTIQAAHAAIWQSNIKLQWLPMWIMCQCACMGCMAVWLYVCMGWWLANEHTPCLCVGKLLNGV